MILQIKNLQIGFINDAKIEKKIVNNFNLTLQKSKITALVGGSGCGKSLIALSILQLLPNTAKYDGEIIFENQNLLELSDENLQKIRGKKISMIFQDPNTALNPLHKIGKQIAEAIKIHNPKIIYAKTVYFMSKLFWRKIYLCVDLLKFKILNKWYTDKYLEDFTLKIFLKFANFYY